MPIENNIVSRDSPIEDKDIRIIPPSPPLKRRRSVTREAGRGLEMTGHAIESLYASEYLDVWPYSRESRFEAIEILKSANREIYYSCPVTEPLSDRFMHMILRLLKLVLRD